MKDINIIMGWNVGEGRHVGCQDLVFLQENRRSTTAAVRVCRPPRMAKRF
jgi:hypothetical protein